MLGFVSEAGDIYKSTADVRDGARGRGREGSDEKTISGGEKQS